MPESTVISVEEFSRDLEFRVLEQGRGEFTVDESDINRPGLQFTGYYAHFASNRIQLLGNAELHYLRQLEKDTLALRMKELMEYPLPCVVVARGHQPPEALLHAAAKKEIPVFGSDSATTKVSHKITNYFDRKLAPTVTRHGVLLDVYGVGVMLTGESGMGKSETALELIKRGHRLVADDVLEIKRVAENRLSCSAPPLTRHLMELRGIGIIDVRYMYGVGAVIAEKSIDLVMELEMWQEGKAYDRLGIDEQYTEVLGVKVPIILVPVRPGRNLAIIVEVAARNYRLKKLGYDAAREFDKRWSEELENR